MPPGHSGCLFRVLPGQFEVISSFPNTKNTNAPKLIVILFEIRKKTKTKQAYEKYSRSKEREEFPENSEKSTPLKMI